LTPRDDALLHGPSVLAPFFLRIAERTASALPWDRRLAAARLWAGVQLRWDSRRRQALWANLAQIDATGRSEAARPESRRETARSMLASGCLSWLDYFAARAQAKPARTEIRFRGTELLYRALAPGRGLVLTLPHLGSWEVTGLEAARLGFRIHVVTGVQIHPLLNGAVRALKESDRIRVSTPEDGFRPLLRTLREGGVVVLLVDGDIRTRTIEAPFFGRATRFPVGPALLARRARAPLLHGHALRRSDGTHELSFDALDEADPRLPVQRDLARLTASMAEAQERNIARHLTQWCIYRPLWSGHGA
jgi:KDO2-lipid IV(A) lauroyltransferase